VKIDKEEKKWVTKGIQGAIEKFRHNTMKLAEDRKEAKVSCLFSIAADNCFIVCSTFLPLLMSW
jgi:hypothetical protein